MNCFQQDAKTTVSLSFPYRHVNALEHLQGKAFRRAQSERGLRDWWLITLVNGMTIHDSVCRCNTSVFVFVICLSGWLCERMRPEDSYDDSLNQSRGPLECRVQEPFWQRASLGGLPRQRDWTGVMIAIRQLYEYLWQTSALKTWRGCYTGL